MAERVAMTIEGSVARVTLMRPEKRNGLDFAMFEGIVAAGDRLIQRRDIRAVVLHGEGECFCSGLDLKSFMNKPEMLTAMLDRTDGSIANLAQRAAWVWQEVPVPTIAALHGVAFGGGLQIALGADIRYVAPGTRLSVMEIKLGLIPDMGISQTLLQLVSSDVARELCFTGKTVEAEEAVQLGLATRLSEDPLADAMATARLIASKSPDAIRANKTLLQKSSSLSVRERFVLETSLQREILGGRNQVEAMMANLQGRDPIFDDPE